MKKKKRIPTPQWLKDYKLALRRYRRSSKKGKTVAKQILAAIR